MVVEGLHEKVLSYQLSGRGRQEILDRIVIFVYEQYRRFGFDDADDASDAVLKYYNRLSNLLDHYKYQGQCFDAYLSVSLRFMAKTIRRDRKLRADREQVCENAEKEYIATLYEEHGRTAPLEKASCLHPPRRPRSRGGKGHSMRDEARSRRLIFLAIKCACELDEEGITMVAEACGVERPYLAALIEHGRNYLAADQERRLKLVEKRTASWSRLRFLESCLQTETDLFKMGTLQNSLSREKRRLAKIQSNINTMKVLVPHSVIASMMGVPKGTVDSGIYYLRKQEGKKAGERKPC